VAAGGGSSAERPSSYYRDAVGGVAISPDSRWVIYEQIDREASAITLVENFR
jgi:hypothetical protein